jgi:hypothetical protein
MTEITAWDGLLVLEGFVIGCLALLDRRPPAPPSLRAKKLNRAIS